MGVTAPPPPRPQSKELVDALLRASRALVGVAARSLQAREGEVTVTQYRVLVLLCEAGTLRVADLAEALEVSPPNATRLCARLGHKGLVRRSRSAIDRRSVQVSATAEGRNVVSEVSAARRAELSRIVDQIPPEGQDQLVVTLQAFSAAAGEAPPDRWMTGWGQ